MEGMRTSDANRIWDIRQKVGMVFQNPDNQLVAAVVEEDVAFGPENLGVPPEEIRERVDLALEKVGMTSYRKQAPSMLSGGQKQRVAIAGVLAMKPDCIVLDEPTAMLDPKGRKEVMDTIHELNKQRGSPSSSLPISWRRRSRRIISLLLTGVSSRWKGRRGKYFHRRIR